MHVLPFLLLSALPALHAFESSAMRARSFKELDKLMGRQIHNCPSVPDGPDICARSCGAGYIQCAADRLDCYNPSLGQICCSNGNHCLAGNVCVDGGSGCCPIGTAISACGAQSTLATIAPPAASSSTSSAAASSSTTSLVVVQTPYANTTFTKPSKSSAATSQEIPVSTAYSTTTIPLAGGGVTTSTALTLVYPTPTMTSSSGPVVINNGGVGLAVPGMIYGMGWLVMIVTLGAML